MADIKILKANGVDVHPVTHEDAVVNNLGLSVGFTYQPKTDNSLKTSAKTIAGGINEINSKKVINDAQNGTVDSIKIRYVKNAGARIYPLCHASKITYTNGETLQTTVNSLSTKNTSVANRVSTLESTLKAIQTNNTSSNTTINTVSTNIGKLSDLQTSAKGNLVAAVNEINQFGSNLKNRLKTALDNKGITDSSLAYTINELVEVVESDDVGYKKPPTYSYTVETASGASYGFVKQSDGTWKSNNIGKDSTAAVAKVTISNPDNLPIKLKYKCNAESSYDYGLLSYINSTLVTSNVVDSSYYMNLTSAAWTEVNLASTSGYYYIKYRKDSSESVGEDCLCFEFIFVE